MAHGEGNSRDELLRGAQESFDEGIRLLNTGRLEEAAAAFTRALSLCRTLPGTQRQQAGCLVNIGGALNDLGRHEEALAPYRQALALYRTLPGTEQDQANCLNKIAASWAGRVAKNGLWTPTGGPTTSPNKRTASHAGKMGGEHPERDLTSYPQRPVRCGIRRRRHLPSHTLCPPFARGRGRGPRQWSRTS